MHTQLLHAHAAAALHWLPQPPHHGTPEERHALARNELCSRPRARPAQQLRKGCRLTEGRGQAQTHTGCESRLPTASCSSSPCRAAGTTLNGARPGGTHQLHTRSPCGNTGSPCSNTAAPAATLAAPAAARAHLQSDVERRGGQRKAQHRGAEAQVAAGAQRAVVVGAQRTQQVQRSAQHLVGSVETWGRPLIIRLRDKQCR